MPKPRLLLIFLIALLFAATGKSQTNGTLGNRFWNNWSLSIGGGPTVFYGDIKQYKFFPASSPINELRFAGTISLNRQLSHVFMLRGQSSWGQLAGEKTNYKDGSICNQYFESTLFEVNLNTTINFTNLILHENPKRFFFVYGTIGAGVTNWITKKKDITTGAVIATDGDWESIHPHLVIPAGLGAYFSIKNKVNLGLEYTIHAMTIDRLDATVGGFPYDSYTMLALNLTYNFDRPSSDKLSSASYQKQIGPPPPQPLLAAEIEAEKKKEQQAKAQASFPKLPPPVADTNLPKQEVLVPDTLPSKEFVEDTVIPGPVVKGVSYRVQVFAFRENTYTAEQVKEKFKLSQTVMKEFSGGWYRYTIGSFTDINAAKRLMTELRTSREIPDAFIAKYVNGKRANPAPPRTVKHSKYSKGKVYYSKPLRKK